MKMGKPVVCGESGQEALQEQDGNHTEDGALAAKAARLAVVY